MAFFVVVASILIGICISVGRDVLRHGAVVMLMRSAKGLSQRRLQRAKCQYQREQPIN